MVLLKEFLIGSRVYSLQPSVARVALDQLTQVPVHAVAVIPSGLRAEERKNVSTLLAIGSEPSRGTNDGYQLTCPVACLSRSMLSLQ